VLTSQATGTLRLEAGCLWLETDPATYLLLWRPFQGFTFRGGQLVVVDPSGVIARVGDVVDVGGGELVDSGGALIADSQADEMIGEPVPLPCRRGQYWLVGGVREIGNSS
jgi:hypothetical protein